MAELLDILDDVETVEQEILFPHVIGQERVKQVLARAARTGRVAHAYLFLGDEGVGKEAAALDFARILLCLSDNERHGRTTARVPCEECDSCVQSKTLSHPAFKVLFPLPKPQSPREDEEGPEAMEQYTAAQQKNIEQALEQKRNNYYAPLSVPGGQEILIDHIRALRQEFRLTSFTGGWRVVFISQADRLRVQAANAFLKLLEEPPANTVFILTSARESRLLSTIVSRCQILRFAQIDRQTIRDTLIRQENVEPKKADTITRLAGGSWQKALEWTKGNPAKETEKAVGVLRELVKGDPGVLDELVDTWAVPRKNDDFITLIDVMIQWLRDVQVYDADPNATTGLQNDPNLVKFASYTEGRPFEKAIDALSQARLDIERNVQPALVAWNLFRTLQRTLFEK